MFHFLSQTLNKLTTYFRAPADEEDDSSSEYETDDEGDTNLNDQESVGEVEYPSDAEGHTTNKTTIENAKKDDEIPEEFVPPVASSSSSLSKEEKRFNGSGVITKINPFRAKAEIKCGKNGSIYEIDLDQHPHCKQQNGAHVNFTAVQEGNKWKIESVKLHSSSSNDIFPKKNVQKSSNKKEQQQTPSSSEVGEQVTTQIFIVHDVEPDIFTIKFNEEDFPVVNTLFSDSSQVVKGDKLKCEIKIKNKEIVEIVSVNWENINCSSGRLRKLNEFYYVEDVVILDKVDSSIRIGDRCDVVFVSSCQTKSVKTFNKRALSIEKLKSRILKDKDFIEESSNSNISILPNPMKMETILDDTMKSQFIIQNKEDSRIILKYVQLKGQDCGVCEFKINTGKQEGNGVICVLGAGESIDIEIECKSKQLGRTTEICSFIFHHCRIDRNICINVKEDPINFPTIQKQPMQLNRESRLLAQENREKQKMGAIKDVMQLQNSKFDHGPPAMKPPFFTPFKIPQYPIPKQIIEMYKKEVEEGNGSELLKKIYPNVDFTSLNYENYAVRFQLSLYLEELECRILRKSLDIKSIVMEKDVSDQNLLYFKLPKYSEEKNIPIRQHERVLCALSSMSLSLDEENSSDSEDEEVNDSDSGVESLKDKSKETFVKHNVKDARTPAQKIIHTGFIQKISNLKVYVEFSDSFYKKYNNEPVDISFVPSRKHFERQHYAVVMAKKHLGENFLFPTKESTKLKPSKILFYESSSTSPSPSIAGQDGNFEGLGSSRSNPNNKENNSLSQYVPTRAASTNKYELKIKDAHSPITNKKLEWFNPVLNNEQKEAVRRVLQGRCRPNPYIIYGPPGTGKTVTLIECVRQVHKLNKQSRILIAVPSNTAGDLIAERLVATNAYEPQDLLRLVAFQRSRDSIPDNILPYCHIGEPLNPIIANHRIIISTLSTACQFFALNENPQFFTHVFVDEAGFATEPEILQACIMTAVKSEGQIVFAGDPMQLVPIVFHNSEVHKILRKSLPERWMANPVYSCDPTLESSNSDFSIMFTTTYRLPEILLKVPSELFYYDLLVSGRSIDENFLTELVKCKILKKKIPLLFHGVRGQSCRDESLSFGNSTEVAQVVMYAQKLKQSGLKDEDIGIITLYRNQVEQIKKALQYKNITSKVATVNEFQGGERKVIIVSTVISLKNELTNKKGFIFNSKMFNVAITRAHSLLIIVGDPHILCSTPWNSILEFSVEQVVYEGCDKPVSLQLQSSSSEEEDSSSIIQESKGNPSVQILNSDSETSDEDEEEFDKYDCPTAVKSDLFGNL